MTFSDYILCKFGGSCGNAKCPFVHGPVCKISLKCTGPCHLRHIGRINKDCNYGSTCRNIGFCRFRHPKSKLAKIVIVHHGSHKYSFDKENNILYVDRYECDHVLGGYCCGGCK